jgi:2-keto-3-deoxy-L-rhamnonate aldolase RhmA
MAHNQTANLKLGLRAREPILGTFIKTPHPAIVEVLAQSDLDCLCLDAEHAPFDRRDLDICLMAAKAGGMPALVRTHSASPADILNALDLGAAGIVVPHVCTAAEAENIVRAAHYGPGGRGFAGGTRAAGFSSPPIGERLAKASAETIVIVQIEDLEALPNVAEIVKVPGIDAIFIGRIDLTVALGETDPKSAAVLKAVTDICRSASSQNMCVGMFTPDLGEIPMWRDRGASFFLLGSDHGFLKVGAAKLKSDSGF